MGRATNRSVLGRSIAEILGTAEPSRSAATRPGPLRKSLIYSSMALLAINPAQVNAVGLGEINVSSQLGQPLRATVPVTLAAGESMPKNCVAPTRGNSGISAPGNMQVITPAATQPGTYNLRLTTTNALHEPMYEISLLIDCPGTPVLLRQYILMLDLPGIYNPASSQTVFRDDAVAVPPISSPQALSPQVFSSQRTTASVTSSSTNQSLQQSQDTIPAGESYRVRNGDSLSTIAARIEGRPPGTTWSAANLIFTMNAHAFIRNNPDLIKLGSLIDVPGTAELAGLERGRSTITPVVTAKQTTAQSETFSKPQPAPTPAPTPIAIPAPVSVSNRALTASNQPQSFVTEPESRQPDATSVTAQLAADLAEDAAVTTPFLDEQPSPVIAEDTSGPAADITVPPVPVVTTASVQEPSSPGNPLLAILVGMLLGMAVSFVIFRRNILATVRNLLARRRMPVSARHARKAHALPATSDNEFNSTDISSVFDETSVESTPEPKKASSLFLEPETESLPICNPAEDTYIVETTDMDSTAEVKAAVLAEIETGNLNINTLENIGEAQPSPDDELLAHLFEENASMIDESDADIFDPTAQLPLGESDLPFDDTVEMPGKPNNVIDSSPTNTLNNHVEQMNAEELFPTGDDITGDFFDAAPTTKIAHETTLENELVALPLSDEDDLSEALNEAMSLLESDFEDEFTSSQILDRSEIARSLDEAETNDDEGGTTLEEKVGG